MTNIPIFQMGQRRKRHFAKEKITPTATENTKTCLTSPATRKMTTKTTVGRPSHALESLNFRKLLMSDVAKDTEKLELSPS